MPDPAKSSVSPLELIWLQVSRGHRKLIYLCLILKRNPHFLPLSSPQITGLILINTPSFLSPLFWLEWRKYCDTRKKRKERKGVSPARLGTLQKITENFYENLMEILTCASGNLNLAKCKARTGFLTLFPYLESFRAGTI